MSILFIIIPFCYIGLISLFRVVDEEIRNISSLKEVFTIERLVYDSGHAVSLVVCLGATFRALMGVWREF